MERVEFGMFQGVGFDFAWGDGERNQTRLEFSKGIQMVHPAVLADLLVLGEVVELERACSKISKRVTSFQIYGFC